ncbi:MAG TPA: MMPL family transporter [Baekduia sp.]|nr:MMPL family transporter [Baekduia sp.]
MTAAARLLRRLRWVVVAAWLAGAAVCTFALPTIEHARTGALGALVPEDADAIKAEIQAAERFAFPLLSRTVLVQRDPDGLSARRQLEAVRLAASLTRGERPRFRRIEAALPLTNALGEAPYARERSTTALTYLFFGPRVHVDTRVRDARRLADQAVAPIDGGVVGVTGQAPALREQAELIVDRLPLIELATLVLVGLAVGVRFRALGAPLLTLVAVAIAYLVSSRVVAYAGQQAGFAVPQEVEPVIVVLLFGVVTDYSIFYLSRFRALLAAGEARLPAADRTIAQISPIIAVAGMAVIAATVTLLAAQLEFLRVFGPGLAFSVFVGLLVALTFVPACLAILGRSLFWPRRPGADIPAEQAAEEPAAPAQRRRRSRAVAFACGRPWTATAVSVAVLAAASTGLTELHLGNPVVRGLPADSDARQAYEAGTAGFAPGVLSPTVVLVTGDGVASERAGLARLQRLLERQRGVALVVGPAQQPLPGVRLGVTRSRGGNAARYFVVLRQDPLGAEAIRDVRRLNDRLPALVDAAGLRGAQPSVAGDTALSAETIDKTVDDLGRIGPIALVALFVVLALYLRALVAPLYLIAASVLAFTAALGLGSYVFGGELTYFVPFAAAVLLVSLGSDYNVFLIGRVWQEAGGRPLHEAVPVAATKAAAPITLAGLVLAGSFALIAIIPVRAFAELAVIMGLGLLLDAFLVRTILVPALVMIVGERSAWPGSLAAPAQESLAR